ncbi:LOW QUALITY PROTEIN: hypothetical protein V2J09_010694 [Rumex salicifolius]
MESIQFRSVSSQHFSPACSPSSPSQITALCSSRYGLKSNSHMKSSSLCSTWTGSGVALGLSSKGSFASELWREVNAKSVFVRREFPSAIRAEMFGQLTSGFESAWSKLKGQEVLTKENIVEPMRDIRRALLEADVSLPVVRRFVQSVSDQAVGIDLIKGVRPDQQLVKNHSLLQYLLYYVHGVQFLGDLTIVHGELVKLMGGEVSELVFVKPGPTVILLAGLQGVGKTTVCAKLAFYLKKLGKSCMLVAGDVYRPAAIDQLVILSQQVDVPVYTAGTDVKPAVIAKQGLEEAKKKKIDVVIVDTAGRLQIDKTMMDELREVKQSIKPTEVLLVVDAMTGQEAAALVTTFNVEIGISGAILTKLDGDSRGGAALSVREVSGKPIKLVGRGERMEDLEPFYPDRMAGRVLGMGDVLSFVEKAQEVMREEKTDELQKKILSAKFDFNDFLKQTRMVARMGSVSRVIGMIPGMGKITPAQVREAEKSLQVMETIIEAMTPEEREKPELLAESPERRKRVAQDSGETEQQVNQLVAQLFQMRVSMKNLMGLMEGNGSIPALNNLEESMKINQKPPPGTARRRRRSTPERKLADPALSGPNSSSGFSLVRMQQVARTNKSRTKRAVNESILITLSTSNSNLLIPLIQHLTTPIANRTHNKPNPSTPFTNTPRIPRYHLKQIPQFTLFFKLRNLLCSPNQPALHKHKRDPGPTTHQLPKLLFEPRIHRHVSFVHLYLMRLQDRSYAVARLEGPPYPSKRCGVHHHGFLSTRRALALESVQLAVESTAGILADWELLLASTRSGSNNGLKLFLLEDESVLALSGKSHDFDTLLGVKYIAFEAPLLLLHCSVTLFSFPGVDFFTVLGDPALLTRLKGLLLCDFGLFFPRIEAAVVSSSRSPINSQAFMTSVSSSSSSSSLRGDFFFFSSSSSDSFTFFTDFGESALTNLRAP